MRRPRETRMREAREREVYGSWVRSLRFGRSGRGGNGIGAVVLRELLDVGVGEIRRDGAHRREVALAALVLLQRRDDVVLLLAAQLRHAVHLGVSRLPVGNAVAALALGEPVLDGDLVVVRRLVGERARGHEDAGGEGEDSRGVHGAGGFYCRSAAANYIAGSFSKRVSQVRGGERWNPCPVVIPICTSLRAISSVSTYSAMVCNPRLVAILWIDSTSA